MKYDGSDKQIAEIWKANKENGFITVWKDGNESGVIVNDWNGFDKDIDKYWIIPDDPLRKMKIRQAETGQPVWVKTTCIGYRPCEFGGDEMYSKPLIYSTTTPDWNIPGAEYSLTEFKEDV